MTKETLFRDLQGTLHDLTYINKGLSNTYYDALEQFNRTINKAKARAQARLEAIDNINGVSLADMTSIGFVDMVEKTLGLSEDEYTDVDEQVFEIDRQLNEIDEIFYFIDEFNQEY